MITDIFSRRYANVRLWPEDDAIRGRLLNQLFKIVSEDLFPPFKEGRTDETNMGAWRRLNAALSRELGVESISPTHYARTVDYGRGPQQVMEAYTPNYVARNFVLFGYQGHGAWEEPLNDRLSLIELCFREHLAPLVNLNQSQGAQQIRALVAQSIDQRRAAHAAATAEINERFRQCGLPLSYHNGIFQIQSDVVTARLVDEPFWPLLADQRWMNVDREIKEAVDRNDSGRDDAVSFAMNALESAIKVISSESGWTRGNERGAANYIDNLASQANGSFIRQEDADQLKKLFSTYRNPRAHGAGPGTAPASTAIDRDLCIALAMTWIRWLVRKHANP